MKVAGAGLRAPGAQHRLLLRRAQAGDRRLALEPRQPQRVQGPNSQLLPLPEKSPSCSPQTNLLQTSSVLLTPVAHVTGLQLQQVGQGLSRDGKALKLAFQHWIEAVST